MAESLESARLQIQQEKSLAAKNVLATQNVTTDHTEEKPSPNRPARTEHQILIDDLKFQK